MEQTRPQQAFAPAAMPDAAPNTGIGPAGAVAAHEPTALLPDVPHTKTESTLAPTAEFTRIFLLAWVMRYIFRGAAKAGFEPLIEKSGIRGKVLNFLSLPGRWLTQRVFKTATPTHLAEMENAAYSLTLGLGSGALSLNYSNSVKKDIQNLFCESVAEEKGMPPEKVSFDDITKSDNKIIQRTVENYREKKWSRLGTDALFFLAAPLRSEGITDLLLGGKGVQIFADTWKRKTTMFEDLVTFVNNKINPRNGLGQPVSLGEVFDLFQHYAEAFTPEKMFNNVLSRNASGRWAYSQPIFQRITDLMNETYAYKHTTPADYHAAKRSGSDFPLPKLIFMLGHDLIDPDRPERTLALVEIMHEYGGAGIKQALPMLQQGMTPQQLLTHFNLAPTPAKANDTPPAPENGVIAKGSTRQVDAVPGNVVEKSAAMLQQSGIADQRPSVPQAGAVLG